MIEFREQWSVLSLFFVWIQTSFDLSIQRTTRGYAILGMIQLEFKNNGFREMVRLSGLAPFCSGPRFQRMQEKYNLTMTLFNLTDDRCNDDEKQFKRCYTVGRKVCALHSLLSSHQTVIKWGCTQEAFVRVSLSFSLDKGVTQLWRKLHFRTILKKHLQQKSSAKSRWPGIRRLDWETKYYFVIYTGKRSMHGAWVLLDIFYLQANTHSRQSITVNLSIK